MATEKKTAAEAKGKKKEAEKPVPKGEKKAAEPHKHTKKEEHTEKHAPRTEHPRAAEHAKKDHSEEKKHHIAKEPEQKALDAVKEKKVEEPRTEEKSAEKEAPKKPTKKSSEKAKVEKKEAKPEKKKKEKKAKPIEKIEFLGARTLSKEEQALADNKKVHPRFIRQEFHKLPRLKDVWRKSRGIDSKKHEGKRGKGETPQDGYKNRQEIRGMTPQGFFPYMVRNLADLDNIDTKKQAAVISASIGRKTRNEIIKAANAKKITILNPRKGERGKK